MIKNKKALLFAVFRGYYCDGRGQVFSPKGKIVNGSIGSNGYRTIGVRVIFDNGKSEKCNIYVHRLQAYQKYGDKIFDKGVVVRHKNNIKTDNEYSNILVGSYSDNYFDNSEEIKNRILTGSNKGIDSARIANLKYDDNLIKSVGDFVYGGMNLVKDAIDKYNIPSSSITRVLKSYREKFNPDITRYDEVRRKSQKNNITKYSKDMIDEIFHLKRSGVKKKDIRDKFNLTDHQLSYIIYSNKINYKF